MHGAMIKFLQLYFVTLELQMVINETQVYKSVFTGNGSL